MVERDLQTLDPTTGGENLVELLVLDVLWHLHEDVVIVQAVFVVPEELFVERQSPALLAVDLEVLHLLAGFLELLGVLDVDHR